MDYAEYNDDSESHPTTVAVLDRDGYRIGTVVNYDAALTIWATMSEDPSGWDEVAGYWSRYRCPVVCEFVDGLPIEICSREELFAAIEGHGNWIAIDLIQKRVITGEVIEFLGREATLVLVTDEQGNQHCPLPIRLPPWWELHEQTSSAKVAEKRESEIRIPRTNRSLLFGSQMIQDLAKRIERVVSEGRLPDASTDERETRNAIHALTVEVHRDWLMTPRQDLSGRRPRDLLHGARHWSDAIIWGQRIRFEDGAPIIATHDNVWGYEDAPMGHEEMIIYFDLCREVISSGWFWFQQERRSFNEVSDELDSNEFHQLTTFLSDVRDHWLDEPFEGGSPPSFIIACSRRRVPRGAGVPIVGMDECENDQHVIDCDCPICDMKQSGLFGVSFTSLDGHHLDLDDEFAFSMHETIEAWQEQQREYAEMTASFKSRASEREAKIASGELEEDEFASVWASPMTEDRLPGDALGHMKLSFRLAEIFSDMEQACVPSTKIQDLNFSFREYRQSSFELRVTTKLTLQKQLDAVADQYPELLPKIADFQSQVDELERTTKNTPSADDSSSF